MAPQKLGCCSANIAHQIVHEFWHCPRLPQGEECMPMIGHHNKSSQIDAFPLYRECERRRNSFSGSFV